MAPSPLPSGAPDAVGRGLLLPEHTVDGVQSIDPAIDKAQNLAPLVGFFLSVTLTSLCFWRLAVFTILALKYRWERPK